MPDVPSIPSETAFQIDFNFHQVPSALALDIPPDAIAATYRLSLAEFNAYAEACFAECTRVARDLLDRPGTREAISRLKHAPHPGADAPATIMTVGDSITTYRFSYAEILRALLTLVEPEIPFRFHNEGRSGYTSTHGLEHTYTQYRAKAPAWVFLKYGVNDTKRFGGGRGKLLVSLQEYTANMARIIDGFLEIGAHVIVQSPSPVVETTVNVTPEFQAMAMTWDNTDIQACTSALSAITAERGVPLVDLCSVFTLRPDPALYVPDGLHPGPAGHRLMIEHVLDAIHSVKL